MDYDNRLVAFLDILGFSSLVKESEKYPDVLDRMVNQLRWLKNRENSNEWGLRIIEIEEDAQKKGVESFRIDDKVNVSCFSDSIIVSVDLENIGLNEAVSSLVANIASVGANLVTQGILVRGGMTVGNLMHTDDGIVIGQALIDAFRTESTVATYPRVVLSKSLVERLNYPLTQKRDRYPYHQYLERFDDGCVGFHQIIFYQVVQSWIEMDPTDLSGQLFKARKTIVNGLDTFFDNPRVFAKYDWLKDRYNELIVFEDGVKKPIPKLSGSTVGHNIHYSRTPGS